MTRHTAIPKDFRDWHTLDTKVILHHFEVDPAKGLDEKEVARRQDVFGFNRIPDHKRTPGIFLLLRQFSSPLVYLLGVAGIVSFILSERVEAGVIIGALFLTVSFGFFQESRATRTIEALKRVVKAQARVIRNGEEDLIEADELVPGDILLVREGDKVPGDARILEAWNLETNEAAITGESITVIKTPERLEAGIPLPDRANMLWMGTIVARGKGRVVVSGTGGSTELGQISKVVQEIEEIRTPLQERISGLARFLTFFVFSLTAGIFLLGIWRGVAAREMFVTSVAVAVAAVPEGLVITLTVILAIGMMRLFKKKALVRDLRSVETLGSATVICTDKTGTLTQGNMKVFDIVTLAESGGRELALKIGLMASDARVENPRDSFKDWRIAGHPTETALLEAALESGLHEDYLKRDEEFIDEIPFESKNQYMATLAKFKEKENILYVKGSIEKVLDASCSLWLGGHIADGVVVGELSPAKARHFYEAHDTLSKEGLRILALGYRILPLDTRLTPLHTKDRTWQILEHPLENLIFVGLVALKDPIRPGVEASLKLVKRAGIRVVMITGDHKLTASAIARELELGADDGRVVEGKDLERMSDEELEKAVSHISVYARISPHDKLRIVHALQARGEVVAMTGDGVNDAPALKKSDIGVAVGSGTDVAKEAADMVILDNNFRTIVRAVKEGRVTFDNLRKVLVYLLADGFTEVVLITGSLLFHLPLPVLAVQILWVNLVEDILPTFALAFEPAEKDVMKISPRKRSEPLLNSDMKFLIGIVGVFTNVFLFSVYLWLYRAYGNSQLDYIRTIIFAGLAFGTLTYVFSIRSLRHPIFHLDFFSNAYLWATVGFGLMLLLIAIYVPFFQNLLHTVALQHMFDWFLIMEIGIFNIAAIELGKWIFIRPKKTV